MTVSATGSDTSDTSDPVTRSRGRTVLATSVVQKIAAQAAAEVEAVGGRSGGWLGIGRQADLRARPDVKADVVGSRAELVIKLGVAYPAPLAAAAQRVRQHVITRVAELTDVEVTRVDIHIVALRRDSSPSSARDRRLT